MKVLKSMLFIIAFTSYLISLGWLYFLFADWFIDLSHFWMIISILMLSSIIWSLIRTISILIAGLIISLNPAPIFAIYTSKVLTWGWGILIVYETIGLYLRFEMFDLLGWLLLSLIVLQLVLLLIDSIRLSVSH
jgi:hypothetical protein